MIKKNLKLLIVTSVVILLPILVGVILWKQLPEKIPTHWNMSGEIDGWSGKPFAVFGLPLMMLGFHWICAVATGADPKNANHSEKMVFLVLWIMPVLTVVLSGLMYMAALGKAVRVETVTPVILGLIFVIIGNYLPKCKQNYTIGIKLPWTLNSEENWNKTHRFASWLWTGGGLAFIVLGFLGGMWIFLPVSLALVLVPMVYSYILHTKGI